MHATIRHNDGTTERVEMRPHTTIFDCTRCGQHIEHTDTLTTGYGTNAQGEKVCFVCCGILDKAKMHDTGKATGYLVKTTDQSNLPLWKVTNWPGTLSYTVKYQRKGHHNIARTRQDVWFEDEHGHNWHGVQYGNMTQLCHCKRLKTRG